MQKLRILIVCSFYAPEIGGGAEMTLQRLASGMAARGHTVAALTTGDGETVDLVDGVQVYRYPIDNTFRKLKRELPNRIRRLRWQWRDRFSAKMATRLDHLIQEFRPDIVQFHNLSGITRSVWAVPPKYRIPSVQVLHDLNLLCPNSSMFRRGKACLNQCISCSLFRYGFATASRDVDAVIGVSNFVREAITNAGYFRNAEKRTIYNAQKLPPPAPTRLSDLLRFGYIGSLIPAKGVEWLINQFDNRFGTLLIAGTGSEHYVEKLKILANGKAITFIGQVNPIQFFSEIDVCVVPSIWNEALGNVAIEASALGRAVIATNRGGLPEIVHDQTTGLLVDPDNPQTLGEAMEVLSDNHQLVARMAAAGPEAVSQFVDLDRFLDQYEGFWFELKAKINSQRL